MLDCMENQLCFLAVKGGSGKEHAISVAGKAKAVVATVKRVTIEGRMLVGYLHRGILFIRFDVG